MIEVGWQVLHDRMARPAPRAVTIADIKLAVCEHFGVHYDEMVSDRRARAIARPRQIAMYLAKELTPKSLPAIGRAFGNRDHTTVMHAIRVVQHQLLLDEDITKAVSQIRRAIAEPGDR